MVTLSKLEYGLALFGAMLVGMAIIFVWRQILTVIENDRLDRQAAYELQMDQLRSEIRLAVIKELGEEDKSGDDEDDSHDDVP